VVGENHRFEKKPKIFIGKVVMQTKGKKENAEHTGTEKFSKRDELVVLLKSNTD